jgi:hypothetical protein
MTPPPGNQTRTKAWNTGSTYYAMLAAAEVFGSSNLSQIVDLTTEETSIYTPQYAVYENGAPTRVALFNFVDDASGANDYTAAISFSGLGAPAQVSVRYLLAPSVSEKWNITWAGQTMSPGGAQSSDGVLHGDVETITRQCDQSANTCSIPVRAPSFALVFLNPQALQDSTPQGDGSAGAGGLGGQLSFTATATVGVGASGVDAGVVQTCMGGLGGAGGAGSTSRENGAQRRSSVGWVWLGAVVGCVGLVIAL